MTHIVYHKGIFIADRKCYGANGTVVQQRKIRMATHGDELWVWAFAGDYAACEYGDKVLFSNFNENVINEAKDMLGKDLVNDFVGLLVTEHIYTKKRTVYLVNYFGLRVQVDENEDLICVGAMANELQRAYKLLRTIHDNTGVEMPRLCGLSGRLEPPLFNELAWLIKHVTHNTAMGQDGFLLDSYVFSGGD